MTWIATRKPTVGLMQQTMAGYPADYGPERRAGRDLPPLVKDDSIVLAHSLIPDAMVHVFQGYRAMLGDDLALTRREQEMIAVTVSALNDCFY